MGLPFSISIPTAEEMAARHRLLYALALHQKHNNGLSWECWRHVGDMKKSRQI
jgi:hypothetical protein